MNDLIAWYPLLLASGVPTPLTRVVRTHVDLVELLDGCTPEGYPDFLQRLGAAVRAVGLPAFLRTGHTSHKHEWRRTCYVTDLNKLADHVVALVEFSELCDMIGLPTQTWVVRQYLDLDAVFTAYNGMPVAAERRFFVGHGRVICHHPYWPDDAVAHGGPSDPGWRERLAEINARTERELAIVLPMAERVAQVFHGWSVDFARAKDGGWYAIDMALARNSYHWPGCEAPHEAGLVPKDDEAC